MGVNHLAIHDLGSYRKKNPTRRRKKDATWTASCCLFLSSSHLFVVVTSQILHYIFAWCAQFSMVFLLEQPRVDNSCIHHEDDGSLCPLLSAHFRRVIAEHSVTEVNTSHVSVILSHSLTDTFFFYTQLAPFLREWMPTWWVSCRTSLWCICSTNCRHIETLTHALPHAFPACS